MGILHIFNSDARVWWDSLHEDSQDDLVNGSSIYNKRNPTENEVSHLYGMFKDFKHFKYKRKRW